MNASADDTATSYRSISKSFAFVLAIAAAVGATAGWKPADLFYDEARAFPISKLSFSGSTAGMSQEQLAQIEQRELRARLVDAGTFTAMWGVGAGALLGLFLGARRSGFAGSLGGFFSGLFVGGVTAFVAGVIGKILSDKFRVMPVHTPVESYSRTYLFQTQAFLLIALAIFTLFLLWGPRFNGRSIKALVWTILAALVSCPVYLAIASVASPLASTTNFIPLDSICRLVWFVTPVTLTTLALGLVFSSEPQPKVAVSS